jgi:hypothetical protein
LLRSKVYDGPIHYRVRVNSLRLQMRVFMIPARERDRQTDREADTQKETESKRQSLREEEVIGNRNIVFFTCTLQLKCIQKFPGLRFPKEDSM